MFKYYRFQTASTGSAAMAIGGAVTSGTAGSVLFVDASGNLGQDNAAFFWDITNDRLGIGTASPISKLEVMNAAATDISLALQAAASQSGDLLQFLDSAGNIMTKFDLNYGVKYLQSSKTISTGSDFIGTPSASTLTVAATALSSFIRTQHTVSYSTTQNAFTGSFFFYSQALFKNASSLTGSLGNYACFVNAAAMQADTNATTATAYYGFLEQGALSVTNSGTLSLTQFNSFLAQPQTVGSGVTVTTHRGVYIQNPAVSGTVTTNTRLEIDDVTTGTTKLAMRVKGTTGVSRHQPKIKFGADTDPAVDADITGAVAYGKSTVSLTADNQTVTTSNRSYISLSSDNAVAINRTFILAQSTVAGHFLVIEWTGTNAAELVDDSAQGTGGNHRLVATWTPTQYDTITFISNGTDWVEIARSVN